MDILINARVDAQELCSGKVDIQAEWILGENGHIKLRRDDALALALAYLTKTAPRYLSALGIAEARGSQ